MLADLPHYAPARPITHCWLPPQAVVAGTPLPNVDTSPMTLTVANGQAIQLTYDMLRDLTPEQIYKIYQTYIKELSVKVVDYSKAEQQDAELAEQVGGHVGPGLCGGRRGMRGHCVVGACELSARPVGVERCWG